MTTVTFISQDGEAFEVDIEVARKSEVGKNLIDGKVFNQIVVPKTRFRSLTFHRKL